MRRTLILLLLAGLFLLGATLSAQPERQPIYVGARACAECHDGPGSGHQFSIWLTTKHSKAYAALALPESKEIARLSGISQEPQESVMCLGCHATASDVEDWEHDQGFSIKDGVQCERCHGPGSEYMNPDVMRDPETAYRLGLHRPERQDCVVCHYEKGSHVAVLDNPTVNLDEAWKKIAHPTPDEFTPSNLILAPVPSHTTGPKYVGAKACGECHSAAEMGFQFSKWRLSRHALAYASLSTPRAREIAAAQGLTEDPQLSDACLKCHATGGSTRANAEEGFTIDEGVGCESCHGPGSEYQAQAVMADPLSATAAGLKNVTLEDCKACHEEAHGKPFNPEEAWDRIAHPINPPEVAEKVIYKTPVNAVLTPDASELYVACEASNSVVVINVAERKKVDEIVVGGQPHDIAFSPDGRRAYVSNRLDDSVSVIDVASRKVTGVASVGDEPHGLITDKSGRRLFVLNTLDDSISVLDTESLKEIKRLAASRNPWSLALSPDGTRLYVTNTLTRFVEFRQPLVSEITVLDAELGIVEDRLDVPGGNLLQGIAWHPSGDFAIFTMNRTKNLVPMTRLLQGWTVTNGIGIAWKDGRVDEVLLDEGDLCFPDPADVYFSPDGKRAFVTSSGSDRVAVLDVAKLTGLIRRSTDQQRREVLPNHTGVPTEFIAQRISVGKSPRGITVTPDGKSAFVVNALDDSVSVIDLNSFDSVERIDLGGPTTITESRWGEQLFHSANIAFHRQFSCHTCHPDGHVDGITYDIEPDGVGVNPVDNRSLRAVFDTAPFKWTGKNPTLQRQCGPRLAVFFTRIAPFNPKELAALELYIATIQRSPNRFRPLGAELTDAQRRGRRIFERSFTNDGREIPYDQRCNNCHPPPLFTSHKIVDVGTKMPFDTEGRFDVPHLNNIYDSAPYLHNGIAHTLEEIWTRYNPQDKHGFTNDLTKDQLNDLIEYLKTL